MPWSEAIGPERRSVKALVDSVDPCQLGIDPCESLRSSVGPESPAVEVPSTSIGGWCLVWELSLSAILDSGPVAMDVIRSVRDCLEATIGQLDVVLAGDDVPIALLLVTVVIAEVVVHGVAKGVRHSLGMETEMLKLYIPSLNAVKKTFFEQTLWSPSK